MPPPAEHQALLDEAAHLLKAAHEGIPWIVARLTVVARSRGVAPVDLVGRFAFGYDERMFERDLLRVHVLAATERLGRMRDLCGPVPWVRGQLTIVRVEEELRARVEFFGWEQPSQRID